MKVARLTRRIDDQKRRQWLPGNAQDGV